MMNEVDTANLVTSLVAITGMIVCLVIGYVVGYEDAKKVKNER